LKIIHHKWVSAYFRTYISMLLITNLLHMATLVFYFMQCHKQFNGTVLYGYYVCDGLYRTNPEDIRYYTYIYIQILQFPCIYPCNLIITNHFILV
jgi:hypothetical protein